MLTQLFATPRSMQVVYSPLHLSHRPSVFEYGQEFHFEVPERIESIMKELKAEGNRFTILPPQKYPIDVIETVHTKEYVSFLKNVFESWKAERGLPQLIPETFYIRSLAKAKPKHLISQAGYFGFDRVTPILPNTFEVALESACCAVTATDLLLDGRASSLYALCRPPGHHAHADLFGGWCYFNNAAIAAKRLSQLDRKSGKYSNARRVTILDVDYHHGNGTQDIFYDSPTVQYVSTHADPDMGGEPYFIGHAAEDGDGDGKGTNCNFPLPPVGVTGERYLAVLHEALKKVKAHKPEYLIVSLGVDTEADDGVGAWHLLTSDYVIIGKEIAALNIPTLIVQEGGYNLQTIGKNVVAVLNAFIDRKL